MVSYKCFVNVCEGYGVSLFLTGSRGTGTSIQDWNVPVVWIYFTKINVYMFTCIMCTAHSDVSLLTLAFYFVIQRILLHLYKMVFALQTLDSRKQTQTWTWTQTQIWISLGEIRLYLQLYWVWPHKRNDSHNTSRLCPNKQIAIQKQ